MSDKKTRIKKQSPEESNVKVDSQQPASAGIKKSLGHKIALSILILFGVLLVAYIFLQHRIVSNVHSGLKSYSAAWLNENAENVVFSNKFGMQGFYLLVSWNPKGEDDLYTVVMKPSWDLSKFNGALDLASKPEEAELNAQIYVLPTSRFSILNSAIKGEHLGKDIKEIQMSMDTNLALGDEKIILQGMEVKLDLQKRLLDIQLKNMNYLYEINGVRKEVVIQDAKKTLQYTPAMDSKILDIVTKIETAFDLMTGNASVSDTQYLEMIQKSELKIGKLLLQSHEKQSEIGKEVMKVEGLDVLFAHESNLLKTHVLFEQFSYQDQVVQLLMKGNKIQASVAVAEGLSIFQYLNIEKLEDFGHFKVAVGLEKLDLNIQSMNMAHLTNIDQKLYVSYDPNQENIVVDVLSSLGKFKVDRAFLDGLIDGLNETAPVIPPFLSESLHVLNMIDLDSATVQFSSSVGPWSCLEKGECKDVSVAGDLNMALRAKNSGIELNTNNKVDIQLKNIDVYWTMSEEELLRNFGEIKVHSMVGLYIDEKYIDEVNKQISQIMRWSPLLKNYTVNLDEREEFTLDLLLNEASLLGRQSIMKVQYEYQHGSTDVVSGFGMRVGVFDVLSEHALLDLNIRALGRESLSEIVPHLSFIHPSDRQAAVAKILANKDNHKELVILVYPNENRIIIDNIIFDCPLSIFDGCYMR